MEYSKTQGVTDKISNMATDKTCFKTVFLENAPKRRTFEDEEAQNNCIDKTALH